MRLEACFDSHVHWAATGEFSGRLRLENLTGPSDLNQLKIERHHRRGEWLLGFGWDESTWSLKPDRRQLDALWGDLPVAFSRCDGHVFWVNTEALKLAGLWRQHPIPVAGGRIEVDGNGWPTGILVDQARERIDKLIPKPSAFEVRRDLLTGVKIFNRAGFTHIRDMTCDEAQWNEAVHLDQAGLLTLAVEEYLWLHDLNHLDALLDFARKAKAGATPNLRMMGVKIFYDGALGSEGALLSRCYHGSQSHGLQLWTQEAVKEVLRRSWEAGLGVAVHSIGDRASAEIVALASELVVGGSRGPLHLEHAEILQGQTVEMMKSLDVECHLQPAHWLSDRKWLAEKVGDLTHHAFPWRKLQEADIRFDFGSDAPIDPPAVRRTLQALRESAEAGVPRLLGMPTAHMSHRDLSWAPNSYSIFEDEEPRHVVFRGEHLT